MTDEDILQGKCYKECDEGCKNFIECRNYYWTLKQSNDYSHMNKCKEMVYEWRYKMTMEKRLNQIKEVIDDK